MTVQSPVETFFIEPLSSRYPEVWGAIGKELGRQRHELEWDCQLVCPSGIANLFAPARTRPDRGASGGHFECVAVPKIEGIGSGVAVRFGGETVAAGTEDRVDLVMGRQKSLRLPG